LYETAGAVVSGIVGTQVAVGRPCDRDTRGVCVWPVCPLAGCVAVSAAGQPTVNLPTPAAIYRYAVDAGGVGVTCPTTGSLRAVLGVAAETATLSVYAAPSALAGLGWPDRYRLAGGVDRGDVSLAAVETVATCRAWGEEWSARFDRHSQTLVFDEQPAIPTDTYGESVTPEVPPHRTARQVIAGWSEPVAETFRAAAARGPLRSGVGFPAGLTAAWGVARAGGTASAVRRLGASLGCLTAALDALGRLRRYEAVSVTDGRLAARVDDPWPGGLVRLVDP
jgi:hypothetical protein